jgi:hypothetical protein
VTIPRSHASADDRADGSRKALSINLDTLDWTQSRRARALGFSLNAEGTC